MGRFLAALVVLALAAGGTSGGHAVSFGHGGASGSCGIHDGHPAEHRYALQLLGGDCQQAQCLDALWTQESGWDPGAVNPAPPHAYGIPQANPDYGRPFALGDWPAQIRWGVLDYIPNRYGSACAAEAHEQAAGWY